MFEHILPFIASPWALLIVAVLVAIDGILPVVPSETLVIGLAALAVAGTPDIGLLIAAAAAGSIASDLLAYRIGRRAAERLGRVRGRHRARVSRSDAALGRARRALARHGGFAVLLGRYIPGGRPATAVAAGSIGLPHHTFVPYSVAGSIGWACYLNGIGYLGGTLWQDHPWYRFLPGILIPLATLALIRTVSWICKLRGSDTRQKRSARFPKADGKPATEQKGSASGPAWLQVKSPPHPKPDAVHRCRCVASPPTVAYARWATSALATTPRP